MEIILYNEESNNLQSVVINELNDLSSLVQAYYEISSENQCLKHNNITIDVNNNIKFYNIKNGDMINVTNKLKNKTNVLTDHLENMKIQSCISYTLVYMRAEYNDMAFKIMIDSGAQISVMSDLMMKFLDLEHLLDKSVSGVVNGVGTSKILGSIYGCDINLNNVIHIPVNFKVIENADPYLILLGIDFLYTYKSVFDFKNRTLDIDNLKLKFLNEAEINDLKVPYNNKKERIKNLHINILNKLAYKNRQNYINLLNKIIDNIVKNPNEYKYKKINLNSKMIKDNVISNEEFISFMNKIGFVMSNDKTTLNFVENLAILDYTKEILAI